MPKTQKNTTKTLESPRKWISAFSTFSHELRKLFATGMITAIGLFVAFAWKDFIDQLLPRTPVAKFLVSNLYLVSFISAILTTLIGVIAIIFISRWVNPKDHEKKG
jgi:type II secretory pathway component PulF